MTSIFFPYLPTKIYFSLSLNRLFYSYKVKVPKNYFNLTNFLFFIQTSSFPNDVSILLYQYDY